MSSENALTFGHLIIPILGLMIPIVAIVAYYLSKAHSERQRHQTIREFARAGQPVPLELLADTHGSDLQRTQQGKVNPTPNRILLPAAINVGLGLGLIGMFAVMSPGSWLWGIGLVPLCLGLGLVLLWAFVRKQHPGL
jgi:Domain of unknown function (DUF6249)